MQDASTVQIWFFLPEKAPICCVIPPASPAATDVLLKVSSRVVLPWSTWPIIVTTGGLGKTEWLQGFKKAKMMN